MNRKLWPLLLLILPLVISGTARGQAWSGIINSTRAINWQRANVGVPGGIPSGSWTQCGATIAAYGTSGSPASPATINNAIAACGARQYVLLGPGTFWLNAGIVIQAHSNVELRGSGPNSTTLEFTSGAPCISGTQNICIINNPPVFPGGTNTLPPCGGSGSANCFNWVAGYGQGATSITISNVGSVGINNGDMITLDQANDQTDNGGEIICDGNTILACTEFTTANARVIGGIDYAQEQAVRVISGCSSTCAGSGPFNLTISPGLYANNWDSTGAVGGFFVKPVSLAGIRGLTVDNSNSTARSNFGIQDCDGCWIQNVRSIQGNRNHVWGMQMTHCEIRDSYFVGTKNGESQSYGIENDNGTDNLIENDIFQQVATPIIGAGGDSGNVYGYNFSIDNVYGPSTYLQGTYPSHDAANSFNLWEGNNMDVFFSDDLHGTSALDTEFRNWLTGLGWNTCTYSSGACPNVNNYANHPSQDTQTVGLQSYNRGYNVIGNVLGTPGYHMYYIQKATDNSMNPYASTAVCNASLFDLGGGNGLCSNLGPGIVANDPIVPASIMIWGNVDVINGPNWATAYSAPAAVAHIAAQSTPSSRTLPPSMYYCSSSTNCTTPPFFPRSMAFPLNGPDVTNGTGGYFTSGTYNEGSCVAGISAGGATCNTTSLNGSGANVAGYMNANPAMLCYFNVMGGPADGSGSPLNFDANACYSYAPISLKANVN